MWKLKLVELFLFKENPEEDLRSDLFGDPEFFREGDPPFQRGEFLTFFSIKFSLNWNPESLLI
jgi:hypothetical protein